MVPAPRAHWLIYGSCPLAAKGLGSGTITPISFYVSPRDQSDLNKVNWLLSLTTGKTSAIKKYIYIKRKKYFKNLVVEYTTSVLYALQNYIAQLILFPPKVLLKDNWLHLATVKVE